MVGPTEHSATLRALVEVQAVRLQWEPWSPAWIWKDVSLMGLHTTYSLVSSWPGKKDRITYLKTQDPVTRSLLLSFFPHSWAPSSLECVLEGARSRKVSDWHGIHDVTMFLGCSSVTSGRIWGAGAMSLEPVFNVRVVQGFTNCLGSATKCLLLWEPRSPTPFTT